MEKKLIWFLKEKLLSIHSIMPHPRFNKFNDLINHLFECFKEEIEEEKHEYESWEEQYENMLDYRINDDGAWAYYGFELDFSAREICFMMKCFNDYDFEINWDNTGDADLSNIIIYYVWRDCAEDIEEYGKEVWGITEQ